MPIDQLGKYQLLRQLSAGPGTERYLARPSESEPDEERVVIARLAPRHASDELRLAAFLGEARVAATLRHPNLVATLEVVDDEGGAFVVQEQVAGADLPALLEALAARGLRLPPGSAVAIVAGVAAGLHHAHEKRGGDGRPLGLVHGALSPSAISVGADGSVKLSGFGVAGGPAAGEAGYRSPEQGRGEPLDRRSDVFGLGLILWELVGGRRAAGAEVPEPPESIAGCPPRLLQAVSAALRRDREQRTPTALALKEELEEIARAERWSTSRAALAGLVEDVLGERREPAAPAPPEEPGAVSPSVDSAESRRLRRHRVASRWRFAVVAGIALAAVGIAGIMC